MTSPVSCPVTAGAVGVGLGTFTPTVGCGEPCRWPGELVGLDVEGLALVVALGVGVGAGVSTAGTGEMAERVAGWAAEDAAADASEAAAAAEDAAAAAWAAAELAAPDPAAAELTAAELPGVGLRSAGFAEVLQAASAENAAIAMTIWVRRAVPVRRAIPHAATPRRALA
jgi:hypothetical protein